MNRSSAVARIKQGLGFRTDLDDECVAMLKEAQRFFEKGKTLPWFLIQETATVTLDEATDPNLVDHPTGFIREAEGRLVHFTNDEDEKIILRKKDFKSAFEAYKDEDAGDPEVYALLATQLYFFPAAEEDASYTITFPYYKAATVLDSDIENDWLEHIPELLIGEAGYRLAADLRDTKAMNEVFDPMRKAAWDAVLRETIAREEAVRDILIGSDL